MTLPNATCLGRENSIYILYEIEYWYLANLIGIRVVAVVVGLVGHVGGYGAKLNEERKQVFERVVAH